MNNDIYLSVVIPAYNEQLRLKSTLETIFLFLKKQKYTWEVIVVDDGSLDRTQAVVKEVMKTQKQLRLVSYHANRGKGYAVNFGMSKAVGELTLFCDADDATPFEQVDKLLAHINNYPVVIGSRHIKGSNIILKQTFLRRLAARLGNFLIQLLLLPGISDTQCGFKLFRSSNAKELISRQTIWGWGFDMELLYIARKLGDKIKQVPIDWYDREGSKIQSPEVFLATLSELIRIRYRAIIGLYR